MKDDSSTQYNRFAFMLWLPRGELENSKQGGSVYFFGSEIWLKFTFLGEKN